MALSPSLVFDFPTLRLDSVWDLESLGFRVWGLRVFWMLWVLGGAEFQPRSVFQTLPESQLFPNSRKCSTGAYII